MAERILVIDDEPDLLELVRVNLDQAGFSVDTAQSGREGLDSLRRSPPDLMILDLMLPDVSGMEICRQVRSEPALAEMPIIMLTAAESDADTILGLDAGANDYVTKPFRLGVLLARLRAQLRQHEHSEDAVFTIGPYTFRPSAKMLIHGETQKKVRLTEKETSILKYLYRSGNIVVGRDTLLDEVWGYNAGVTTHTLETHVYRLRQKIEADPSNAEILVTEPGGYRLVP
jgi:DNA-binding response OmpR family regulator